MKTLNEYLLNKWVNEFRIHFLKCLDMRKEMLWITNSKSVQHMCTLINQQWFTHLAL